MIICLSGFVIAGSIKHGLPSRVSPAYQLFNGQVPAPPPAPRPACSPAASVESVNSIQGLYTTRVRTLYGCIAACEGELSFGPNEVITNVRPSPEPGWLRGTLNGKTGLIPENYVETIP